MKDFRTWFRERNETPEDTWAYFENDQQIVVLDRLMNGVADYVDEAVSEMKRQK